MEADRAQAHRCHSSLYPVASGWIVIDDQDHGFVAKCWRHFATLGAVALVGFILPAAAPINQVGCCKAAPMLLQPAGVSGPRGFFKALVVPDGAVRVTDLAQSGSGIDTSRFEQAVLCRTVVGHRRGQQ